MKLKQTTILLISCLFAFQPAISQIKIQRNQSFDSGWKFMKGMEANAQDASFDDSSWRDVDVPHDWSIEDLSQNDSDSTLGPFHKNAVGKNNTGFTIGGTAWYRKHFSLDKAISNKVVYIQFDGVYMNSDVWINGHHLGNRPNGYASFVYDVTSFLSPAGKDNVIAVEVKNEGVNSRWYTGSGIYRHVWIHVVNKTHIENWGVQIVSDNVSAQSAGIGITARINNSSSDISLTTELYALNSNQMVSSTSTQVDGVKKVEQRIVLHNPKLWDLENPHLYKVRLILRQNNKMIDEYNQNFGVRTVKVDAEKGFVLNGKSVKLKGGCIHHDNGPLGSVAIDRAEERKIQLLKINGYNAVRLAHNPFSSELLEACDRLGILVINESFDVWNSQKTTDDYSKYFNEWWEKDLAANILKDINHPSIVMWSIGNEIPEIVNSTGHQTSLQLANAVHQLDPSRLVTNAIPFYLPLMKGLPWDVTAPAFATLDVGGYNYTSSQYVNDHKKYPSRVMVATEYFPPQALQEWNYVENNVYIVGMFSWSAMDYLGEAGLGLARLKKQDEKLAGFQQTFMMPEWPIFNAYTGELDLIGNKKSASYYLDVVWRNSPIEMLVHRPIPNGMKEVLGFYDFPDELKCWTWNGHENDSLQVRVFSRSSKVKLELNGKIIAEQTIPPGSITATFSIPYVPGKLTARCYDERLEVASETIATAGKPAAIRLKADRLDLKASKNDLAYIDVEIIDVGGNIVPNVDDILIKYRVTGNVTIAAVGNGNPRDMSSFVKPEKKVFHGKGLVILRPEASSRLITLHASAEGLQSATLTIKAEE